MFRLVALCVLTLFSTEILASSSDVALEYLGQIFGSVSSGLMAYGVDGKAASPTVTSLILKQFNQLMLVVAGVVFLYILVMGTLKTATTGKFLGERWSGALIPLRTVFGIGMLLPTATGYCCAQVLILWVVAFGSNFGSSLWSEVLHHLSSGYSVYGDTAMGETVADDLKQQSKFTKTLMRSLVCVAKNNAKQLDLAEHNASYTPQIYGYGFVEQQEDLELAFGYRAGVEAPQGRECGTIVLPKSEQADAYDDLLLLLNPLAKTYVSQGSYAQTKFQLKQILSNFPNRIKQANLPGRKPDLQSYAQNGWLLAGNYYREVTRYLSNSSGVGVYPSRGSAFDNSYTDYQAHVQYLNQADAAFSGVYQELLLNIQERFGEKSGAKEAFDNLAELNSPDLSAWWYVLNLKNAFVMQLCQSWRVLVVPMMQLGIRLSVLLKWVTR